MSASKETRADVGAVIAAIEKDERAERARAYRRKSIWLSALKRPGPVRVRGNYVRQTRPAPGTIGRVERVNGTVPSLVATSRLIDCGISMRRGHVSLAALVWRPSDIGYAAALGSGL